MPSRPLRPCAEARCSLLTTSTRCPAHTRQRTQAKDAGRPSASQRGYGTEWLGLRARHLKAHPQCEPHRREGILCIPQGKDRVVDHKIPHKGDRRLLLDPSNLETSCKSKHDQKTARHDGGFGRTPRQATA